jgi:hypothetical protein
VYKETQFKYIFPQTYYAAVGQLESIIKPDPAHALILAHNILFSVSVPVMKSLIH